MENLEYAEPRVEFVVSRSLGDEMYPYLTQITGRIIIEGDEGPQVIGHLYATRIEASQMLNDGMWDPVTFADELNGEHGSVAHDVFGYRPFDDPETGNDSLWSNKLVKAIDPSACGDLLYLASMTIDPKFRGHKLGLKAVTRCIETFADWTTVVACMPHPLDLEKDESGKVINQEALKKGKIRLGSYWSRLGFSPLPDSNVYAMSMECRQPGLDEVFAS